MHSYDETELLCYKLDLELFGIYHIILVIF